MGTDETNDFTPEHLAKWRKITREYVLAPMEWRELGERIQRPRDIVYRVVHLPHDRARDSFSVMEVTDFCMASRSN